MSDEQPTDQPSGNDVNGCEILDTTTRDVFHVSRFGLLIGRFGGPAVIQVRSDAVQKRHARIVLRGGGWHIETINPDDRIVVDGKSCQTAPLTDGTVIEIAKHKLVVQKIIRPTALVSAERHRRLYLRMPFVHILRALKRMIGRLERMLTPRPLR